MLTVRLLGQVRFEFNGTPWVLQAPPKTIALLGYLATHRASSVPRDFVARKLWPADTPDVARAKLRRHFHMLLGALPQPVGGTPYTLNTRHTAKWNDAAEATVDVIAFEDACRTSSSNDANTWYGGDFLEAFSDAWVLTERERLRLLRLEGLRAAIQRKRVERDFESALADMVALSALDPWREDTLRTEMQLRSDLGDRGGAIAAYRGFERRLRTELDVEPLPETRAAYERLLHGDERRIG